MANVYTTTSVTTNLVQGAYDKYVEFALRTEPLFRDIADKRPVNVTSPGSSVTFQLYADLAVATSTLTENVDPDSVALSNTTTVAVTLNEYGNVVLMTEKLEYESLSDIDPAAANMIAFNMRDSLDALVRDTIRVGTNVIKNISGTLTVGGTTANITATDTISSPYIRYCVAKLRGGAAVPRKENLYWCGIHPDVSHDLRKETGAAAWRDPHNYSSPSSIWAGEIGQYEGAFFVESPRMYSATDGSTSTKVHRTLFAGKQALAEAVAYEPHVVFGPVTDKLMRFRPLGWKGLLGWAIYRQASLFRVETAASI